MCNAEYTRKICNESCNAPYNYGKNLALSPWIWLKINNRRLCTLEKWENIFCKKMWNNLNLVIITIFRYSIYYIVSYIVLVIMIILWLCTVFILPDCRYGERVEWWWDSLVHCVVSWSAWPTYRQVYFYWQRWTLANHQLWLQSTLCLQNDNKSVFSIG